MRRGKAKSLEFDVRPVVEFLGWQESLRQTGVEGLVAELTPEQYQEIVSRYEQRQAILCDFIAQLTLVERQRLLALLKEQLPKQRRKQT